MSQESLEVAKQCQVKMAAAAAATVTAAAAFCRQVEAGVHPLGRYAGR